jgi:RHS repeat-associated protein
MIWFRKIWHHFFRKIWHQRPQQRRTRRDHLCSGSSCASTITRTVWDGDQILYEIRADGGNVSAATLENDNSTGAQFGRVGYTHGAGIDQPLEIIRIGFTPNVDASYGISTWNGPYPIMPYTDWHGAMDGATTATGRQIPCNTTENLCSEGIWPASNMNAFYSPNAAVDHQAWFGSLTTGNADASGLMYMRNRYYNPQTGTFTQPDPIGIAGGLNVYGYVSGDPVNYDDPFGLAPCKANRLRCEVRDFMRFYSMPREERALKGAGVHAKVFMRLREGRMRVFAGVASPGAIMEFWPATVAEMDQALGFEGRRIPDGPRTPGRNKVEWRPNESTKIIYEEHPYHTEAPDWHRGPHWHLDTPGAEHLRYLAGDKIP